MIKWKRVGDGLYQRFGNGIEQNIYIGRFGDKGKATAWQGMTKINGKFEQVDWFCTLREAKASMTRWN